MLGLTVKLLLQQSQRVSCRQPFFRRPWMLECFPILIHGRRNIKPSLAVTAGRLQHSSDESHSDRRGFFFAALWLLLLLMPVYPEYDKILLALGVFWILWRWLPQRPRLGLEFLHLPLAAFFGWMLVSTIAAVDSTHAWDDYFFWVAHLLAFLMFVDVVRTPRQLGLLALALVLGHTYLGLACIADYFTGVYRIGGPGDYWPTVLGCYLNFALPWTIGIAYVAKSANLRFLLALVILLLLFALGATLARASLIGLFVTLLVLSKYFLDWHRWRFPLVLVSLFVLLLLFPGFLARLHLIAPETLGDLEFSRPMFWKSSLDLLDEGTRLVTGVGMGNSFHLVFRHEPVATVDGDFYALPHAHNFLIHFLVIWGLPGLLAYLWFVGSCTAEIAKTFRHNPSSLGRWIQWVALATLLGFWVEELFHVSVLYRNNMAFYWWTLAVGIVAGRLPVEGTKREQEAA